MPVCPDRWQYNMLTLLFTLFSTVFDMSVRTDTSATKSLPSCRRKTESPVPRTAPDLPKDLQRHWPRQCRKDGLMAGSRKEHSVFYHGFTMLQCLDTLVKVSKCQGLEGNCDTHSFNHRHFWCQSFWYETIRAEALPLLQLLRRSVSP